MQNSGQTSIYNLSIYNCSFKLLLFVFSLLEAVAGCPQFGSLMSEDVVSAINKIISQGAYYKPAAMEDPMVLEL